MGNHDVWADERLRDEREARERQEANVKKVLAAVEEWLRSPYGRAQELRIARKAGAFFVLEEKVVLEVKP